MAGIATPPPLDEVAPPQTSETFEEKAQRVLEPSSSFEAGEAVGFEATPQVKDKFAEVAEPAPEAPPIPVSSDDPFGEAPSSTVSEEVVAEEPVVAEASEPRNRTFFTLCDRCRSTRARRGRRGRRGAFRG